MFEQVISVDRMEHAVSLFGSFDENIRQVEEEYSVKVISRGSDLKVSGEAENVAKATRAIEGLLTLINKGEALSEQNVRYVLSMVNEGSEDKLSEMVGDCICITAKGKPVKPKTLGQKKYVEAIRKNIVTLGAGPAGTGKTYLAVAMAVTAFRAKEVNRIILTRPAVEAGEKLGFLPGDLQQRLTRICARFMTRCSICSARRRSPAIRSAAVSKLHRSRICAGARSTTALLFWTKRKTPRANK